MMENTMDKNMENAMETRAIDGLHNDTGDTTLLHVKGSCAKVVVPVLQSWYFIEFILVCCKRCCFHAHYNLK